MQLPFNELSLLRKYVLVVPVSADLLCSLCVCSLESEKIRGLQAAYILVMRL